MKLYNSLSNQKEEFVPLNDNEVKIYACGPTVYNYFHLGNARAFIIFDVLRSYLEYKGYKVIFVQNFTDIDDKMIKRANEEGITVFELAKRFINEYFTDARGLGIKDATIHPRATENINEIIDMISSLIDKGYAYEANGDVYFAAKNFKDYGKLSHQPLEELEAGARIEVNDIKQNPMDFALWKAHKEGEPYWESPWGKGRPGWHIECSVMATKYLGKTIDIHCGGKDLVFPHHENEIAQSECANGCEFARFWLHNGYINVDNQKMSKSLGNFFTVRDISKVYEYDTIRFFILSAHYRSPINYSADILEQAKAGLTRIINCVDNLNFLIENNKNTDITNEEISKLETLNGYKRSFTDAMDDDLNTADAISYIFELVKDININSDENSSVEFLSRQKALLQELCSVLGINIEKTDNNLNKEIEALIEKRETARKNKDYKTADEIRDKLKEMGIALEDTKQGIKWKKIK